MLDLNISWNSTIILPRLQLSKEDYSNHHGINDIIGNNNDRDSDDNNINGVTVIMIIVLMMILY